MYFFGRSNQSSKLTQRNDPFWESAGACEYQSLRPANLQKLIEHCQQKYMNFDKNIYKNISEIQKGIYKKHVFAYLQKAQQKP